MFFPDGNRAPSHVDTELDVSAGMDSVSVVEVFLRQVDPRSSGNVLVADTEELTGAITPASAMLVRVEVEHSWEVVL